MFVATKGRASLRHVTVTLPRNWRTDSLTCSLLQPVNTASPAVHAHISISQPHPVFGNRPWAQQSQGCGRPGDKIRLGGDSLRGGSNESHSHTARLLLAEWAKFRWGVFEERGIPGDPLYPPQYRDPSTHRWESTVCADGPIHAPGPECDPSRVGCPVSPDHFANTHLTSSLLALPDLPSVRLFCDDPTHNKVAPTKHNSLCGTRSTWEIIQGSVDFILGRNPVSNATRGLEPAIKFVKEEGPRYVLVIEDTASMNLQRRWEYLRKAIRRVVVYDVPDRSHVGIVTFNSVAKRVAPLNFIESEFSDKRQKVGSALPRNPSTVPESHKCILCGLQEALRTIDEASQDAVGANIILVSSGAGVTTHHQMDEMIHLIESRGISVTPVIYPMTERSGSTRSSIEHGLEPLSGASGRSFTVMDEGVGNDSKVSMLVALMDALMAAVRYTGKPDLPGSPVLVHKSAYPGGIASMSTGSFALDDSLGPNARFSVYYYDLNHVGNAIQLTSPSGETLVPLQEEDGDVNMIFVNLEKAERGLWSYTVENRADSHQGLYVQVTAKRNTSAGLSVKLWTSPSDQAVNASDRSSPVILFASVTEGESPVLNARVVATLQRLGVNATGSSYEPISIELLDNGIGGKLIDR
ncbi:Calcium-activated chloride channel N-terminal [Trinorchestia longiramus]|nr:Calcium-activated chloride channel N-terminal [Trinorchestia longiramus]